MSYTITAPLFANDTEPNNSFAEADANGVLAPATTTEGHVNFSHYVDNSDYYRIETPGDGVLNITLNSEAVGAGHLRVDVYNDAGAQLHYNNYAVGTGGTPNSVTQSHTCDAQGVYYLEVSSTSVCGVSYQLSYTVTPPVFGNDTEPNGSTATAIAFNPDSAQAEGHLNFSHYVENSDHYKVILPVAGAITFDLEAEAATAGNLRINLLNNVGSQITYNIYTIGSGGIPAGSLVNFAGLAAGTYYLELYATNVCGASYRMHCNDADDDGVCNYFDLCPGTPNGEGVNDDGCACSQLTVDDGDPCTLDECTDGIVTHTFQDADGDLICDANDNCPNLAGVQGDPCDDGDANTGNDIIDANCVCAGQLIDCLGVPGGPALPGTACDDGNPNSSNDTWDANCNCVGTLPDDCLGVPGGPAQPGTACDDGNANTGNDTWDANCNCVGQTIDCLGVAGGPALPGTACDDGNANTGNDTWDANCNCVGQTIDCLGVPGGPALPGTACDDGNPNSANDTWDANCNCVGTLADDCLGVPGGPAQPGTPCDDGDANTGNDTWDANCVCVGQLLDCNGVPGGPALPGTACDDGNANTGNDTWDANCNCVGQTIDCLGVVGGPALPGTACDDGNPNSANDTWDANCNCVGTLADDCLGVPGGPAQPGTPCDDGQAQTGNDTWDANCNCVGQLLDCNGVPGGPAQPGTACDDGDACTTGDVYDANCNCAGTFADADNDGTCDADDLCPASPEPGQACDDGNPLTDNDVVDNYCVCAGTPIGGCTEILTLDITLDDNGSQTTWEIRDETGNTVILSGGPYQNGLAGTTVTETLCLNQLCYRLVVNDNGGDGINGGGYVLRDANNRRIVDANGAFTNTSSVANEFCLPLSAARLINASCDRTNLLYKTSTQIYASFYPGASGYQFWIFDPHGSYSRRVFSATQNLVPANLVTNPVPADMDLNVRVRALVGGNYTEFGAACRFRLNTPGGGGREAILFDEAGNMTMSLYPNPNRGEVVNVAFDGIAAAERMDIEVLDIFGKRVSAQQIAAPGGAFVHTMDLSALAPGVYLVNVRVNDRFHTQRLVRQ
ncbi:MAG: hypothetical protein GFGODING_02777 [Flavobacteriales bacterium]|nr:hypothetical protein [Flavobacteriales bacterium]